MVLFAAVACLALPACGGSSSAPSSGAPLVVPAGLRAMLAAWQKQDPALTGRPPAAVLAAARRERELVYRLAHEAPAHTAQAIAALPAGSRPAIIADVAAARTLRKLDGPPGGGTFHLEPATPAGELLADYRAAQRRFHVQWQVLAAINFVESAFGRAPGNSSAGAQGPMQFEPATWNEYGLGGNVHSTRDAIMGAANYLHHSGSPSDNARALYAYNPSKLYVSAVLTYARQMRDDPLGFLAYYTWEASLPSVLHG